MCVWDLSPLFCVYRNRSKEKFKKHWSKFKKRREDRNEPLLKIAKNVDECWICELIKINDNARYQTILVLGILRAIVQSVACSMEHGPKKRVLYVAPATPIWEVATRYCDVAVHHVRQSLKMAECPRKEKSSLIGHICLVKAISKHF